MSCVCLTGSTSFTGASALTFIAVCRWAQLPLGVALAVCRGLSARHRRELKKRMELHAKSPLEQPYRCVEEVQNALRAILSMV